MPMQRLLLLGLNHATAPLEVRERLAFNAEQRRAALEQFRQQFGAEAVLLSTCNRVELYAARPVHGRPREAEMLQFLCACHGLSPEQVQPHTYAKADQQVIEHLFAVASSLDSMVVGETQILGQVREAYDAATAAASAGPLLNPLFQRALAVGKQVMTQTALGAGRLSVASVAVDHARRIFEDFTDKTVLSIGAGKMAVLVLKHFAELRPGRLLICNRDPAKASALADQHAGQAVPFERLPDHLVAADIVVSSTGSQHPIITRAQFAGIEKQRRYRPIFLIDIALPRDIEASVGELDNVYLYNIDDLQQVVSQTQGQRLDATDAARLLVARQVREFLTWRRQRELGPLIESLYRRYHAVAQDEVARTLNKLANISEAEKAHLEELARRIVNKLLHEPVAALRNSGEGDETQARQFVYALEKLLGMEASED